MVGNIINVIVYLFIGPLPFVTITPSVDLIRVNKSIKIKRITQKDITPQDFATRILNGTVFIL